MRWQANSNSLLDTSAMGLLLWHGHFIAFAFYALAWFLAAAAVGRMERLTEARP